MLASTAPDREDFSCAGLFNMRETAGMNRGLGFQSDLTMISTKSQGVVLKVKTKTDRKGELTGLRPEG